MTHGYGDENWRKSPDERQAALRRALRQFQDMYIRLQGARARIDRVAGQPVNRSRAGRIVSYGTIPDAMPREDI